MLRIQIQLETSRSGAYYSNTARLSQNECMRFTHGASRTHNLVNSSLIVRRCTTRVRCPLALAPLKQTILDHPRTTVHSSSVARSRTYRSIANQGAPWIYGDYVEATCCPLLESPNSAINHPSRVHFCLHTFPSFHNFVNTFQIQPNLYLRLLQHVHHRLGEERFSPGRVPHQA